MTSHGGYEVDGWYHLRFGKSVERITRLHAEQDGRCYYCECRCWIKDGTRDDELFRSYGMVPKGPACRRRLGYMQATVEHLQRLVDEGDESPANLAMACQYCNSTRHGRTVSEHLDLVRDQVAAGEHPCRREPVTAVSAGGDGAAAPLASGVAASVPRQVNLASRSTMNALPGAEGLPGSKEAASAP